MNQLVLTPRISEKAVGGSERGVYTFEVPKSANKIQVAHAVASRFKVEVKDVNMMIVKGKVKRFKRIVGRENDTKKAVVRLKPGQTIAMFEGAK